MIALQGLAQQQVMALGLTSNMPLVKMLSVVAEAAAAAQKLAAASVAVVRLCKPIDWAKVQLDLDAIVREVDTAERRRKVIRRFQRTMKRHERRARRLGLPKAALTLAVVRSAANAKDERWMREHAAHCRSVSHAYGKARRVAWVYERAAAAVARLRSDLEAVK